MILRSSHLRSDRGNFHAFVMMFVLVAAVRATSREITVHSWFTDAGKSSARPRSESMVRCRLFTGGYQEIGVVTSHPPSPPPSAEFVGQHLTGALRANGFFCSGGSDEPALMLIYQWGFIDPPRLDGWTFGETSRRERLNILTIVGGVALAHADPAERALILEAARAPRYFVVVSAYDFAAYAAEKAQRLLWRTHISVPASGLTHEGAIPLMMAAGATLFGRETPVPRRITIDVSGTLRPSIVMP